MTGYLRLSSWIYARLVSVYPEDLRRDFGADMALVFADDLAAARRAEGLIGITHVWWCALREVLTIALPCQRTNPRILVPVASFAVNAMILGAELVFALHHPPSGAGPYKPLLTDAIRTVVLWPSVATALIALAISRTSTRGSITSLQLVSPSRERQRGL